MSARAEDSDIPPAASPCGPRGPLCTARTPASRRSAASSASCRPRRLTRQPRPIPPHVLASGAPDLPAVRSVSGLVKYAGMCPDAPRRLLLAAALATLACGDSPGPAAVTEDEAAARFASARCGYVRELDCDVPSTCEAEVEKRFAAAQAQARAEGRTFDPACLQTRVDPLESNGYFIEAHTCPVYPGPIGPGEPCQQEGPYGAFHSCAADLACQPEFGVCVPLDCSSYNHGFPGEPCLAADSCPLAGCEADAEHTGWCDITAAAPVCAVQAEPGEPCTSDLACTDDHRCDAEQRCSPRLAAGATCARGSECVSSVCATGTCSPDDDSTGCR
jgi:hypothetical protein